MLTSMFLRMVALIGILVGAVVATAEARAWWTVALAVAGLIIAAGLIAASVLLGTILVSVGRLETGGGLALETAGVAAAVFLAAAVLALSRRAT